MQQEFISTHGKVILENDVLYIRKLKPSLALSQFVTISFPVLIIIRFVLYIFEENSPKRNMALVVLGLLSVFYGIELSLKLYKAVFKQSFAKRILLANIRSYHLEEDVHDLDVYVYLQLKSGRERKITFRKREEQHEELITALSQYLAVPNITS